MNIEALLAYMKPYISLTDEEIAILQTRIKFRKYLKGQFIVQEGDVCRHVSFVLKGCAKIFYVDNEGSEQIVRFALENWWISDIGSFINQTPAEHNVQCLEATELIQFQYDQLEQLYKEVPKFERLFRIIGQKSIVALEKRLIKNFTLTAKERYLAFRKQYPQIEQRVPQYMVASYLGITKEFLSKIRSQLISEQ